VSVANSSEGQDSGCFDIQTSGSSKAVHYSQFVSPSDSGKNLKEQHNGAFQRDLLCALQGGRRMTGKKCLNNAVEKKVLAEEPG
jgi:hypothetical protein